MSKEENIQVEGRVIKSLPNANFEIEVREDHKIRATICGKMRKNFIKVIVGDKVMVELTPYDLFRGRIVERIRI